MGLGFKLKRKNNNYMSYSKISQHRQLNFWRMKINTCTGKFQSKTTILTIDPSARKLQETRNKQNRIKENEQNGQAMYTSNQ